METLDILSDPELMGEIRRAEAELDAGEFSTLEEVAEEMRACWPADPDSGGLRTTASVGVVPNPPPAMAGRT